MMPRNTARISINKLGEYMVSRPGRRRTIVKDQKNPSSFIVAYYSSAEDIMCECIIDKRDHIFLESKIQELYGKTPSSDWDSTRKDVCIEALNYFIEVIDDLELPDFDKEKAPKDQEKITISNVDISVRPEVLLKKDNQVIGAIKFVINKNKRPDSDEINFIGAVLHHYMRKIHSEALKAKNCFIVDVFAGEVFNAPKSFKQRLDDVDAACSEIADAWKRV